MSKKRTKQAALTAPAAGVTGRVGQQYNLSLAAVVRSACSSIQIHTTGHLRWMHFHDGRARRCHMHVPVSIPGVNRPVCKVHVSADCAAHQHHASVHTQAIMPPPPPPSWMCAPTARASWQHASCSTWGRYANPAATACTPHAAPCARARLSMRASPSSLGGLQAQRTSSKLARQAGPSTRHLSGV
jgi:hypothetical protein